MTLCIAAAFKEGVLCATDSSISIGNNRLTSPTIKGIPLEQGFVMFSGMLAQAQEVLKSCNRISELSLTSKEVVKEADDENDGLEFLAVDKNGHISYIDDSGAVLGAKGYAAIGHASTLGLALLEMIYQPNRSEQWLRNHIENIMRIVEKYDSTVFRPTRFHVVPAIVAQ